MQWFRFYSEALDDPKVQRLPGDLFKAWVNLLCLANEQEERGTLPPLDDITFRLRLDYQKCEDALLGLKRAGLLDIDPETDLYVIHAWAKRQPPSDIDSTAAERKRRERERKQANKPVTRDVTRDNRDSHGGVTGDVTRLEKSRVEKNREEQSKEERKAAASRGTPAPDIFPISDAMRDWSAKHAPGVDIERETEKFLFRNRSKGILYKDWLSAWKNWMLSDYAQPTARAPTVHATPTNGQRPTGRTEGMVSSATLDFMKKRQGAR